MSKGEISPAEAITAIARFKVWRQEIFELYATIFARSYSSSFWDLLLELPGLYKPDDENELRDARIDMLVMKCGLLDAALTKYFKSDGAFQDLLKIEALNK